MKILIRTLVLSIAAMLAMAGPAQAQHRYGGGHYHGGYYGGYRGGGYWGPGLFLGGLGLGVALSANNYYYRDPYYPGYVVVDQPPPVVYESPAPRQPAAARAPDPVIYPRNGQSAQQLEADEQACNRWATSQPSAMADASVFQRSTTACLEGRGYTVR